MMGDVGLKTEVVVMIGSGRDNGGELERSRAEELESSPTESSDSSDEVKTTSSSGNSKLNPAKESVGDRLLGGKREMISSSWT